MECEYRITVIKLVSEEKIYPILLKFLRKYIYLLPYLRHKTRIILLLRHQDQCIYIHIVIFKLLIVFNQILKSLQFLRYLTGSVDIIPEIRLFHLIIKLCYSVCLVFNVKG